ncbi:MAG: LacI family DNA-binding transcriptional regulator [Bifidobacterium aquikefiri]|uniref:LacI family transcriptional regulator n=1 Tax=Bifidobacterium aquikefiri TaxID=1653207 RepID=A0A261G630_9BIFI|nr:LacI family DNA-binding transcriptional regulator [Bifidobacterium aquikefiri]OZG66897.1 LacI family transcriptional regulator [Bifidobacterium aquikefiri]
MRAKAEHRVLISDVAKASNVSIATVSRVLTQTGRVNQEKRERVLSAAKALGYKRNPFASALRSRRTDTVGMVMPTLENPFFSSLAKYFEKVISVDGFNLVLCSSEGDPTVEHDKVVSLLNHEVSGIVISPADIEKSTETISQASAQAMVVQVDQRVSSPISNWVGINDDLAMKLIVSHFRSRGFKTAGFIGTHATDSSAADRLSAFKKHCQAEGIITKQSWIQLGEHNMEWGQAAIEKIVSSGDIPRALACSSDMIALGALNAIRTAGLNVPEEIAISGFDDTAFAKVARPSLTTIHQPYSEIASETWHLLHSHDSRPSNAVAKILLTPRLVVRSST